MTKSTDGPSPSNLAHQLRGIDFPARKKDLIKRARGHHAGEEIIRKLEHMPDQEYKSMADVMAGFGHTENIEPEDEG